MQGLTLRKKSSQNIATRYEKLVAISQILVTKSSCCVCVVRVLAKQNMSPQYTVLVCTKEITENGE